MDAPVQRVASRRDSDIGLPQATLFGPFALRTAAGQPFTISNARARAILALLSLAPGEPLDRDQLSEVLWPGRFHGHARASLRQCLFELNKLLEPLGSDLLVVTRKSVALNPDGLRTDLDALERALEAAAPAAAARLLGQAGTAALLERLDFGDGFAALLERRRHAVEQRLRAGVERALAQLEQAGDHDGHRLLAEAWRQRDPAFGLALQAPASPEAVRVAVLPFRALMAEAASDYFSDGIVEELITTLSRVPELQVAGRTSSFHFRSTDLPAPEIAAALRVTHLVEGTVQCLGEQVRIHVHLTEGSTGFELWGARYDGTLSGLFALQEEVAQAVTSAIGTALGVFVQRPSVPGPTFSKEAYDLYLQGLSLCARRFGEGVLGSAVHLFEQAVAIDPDFAECWVALAEAHQLVSVYTQCLDRNGEAAKMAECAARAIELNPQLGYAHSLLGLYELTRFNFVGALEYGFKGYALEPGNPAVALRLGCFLAFIGRTRDAAPYLKAALDLDPVDGRKYAMIWGVHFCQGHLEEALAAAERMVDLGMMAVPLGVTLAAMGRHELAIEKYLLNQNVLNGMILPPVGIGVQTPEAMAAYWNVAAKGMCSGEEADRQTYWQVLEMLFAVLHDKSDPAISGPAIFTGNPDLAYRTIGQKITPANLMALVPLWTPVFPICRIWQHPGFVGFARKIGMADAWDRYGWPDVLPPPGEETAPA